MQNTFLKTPDEWYFNLNHQLWFYYLSCNCGKRKQNKKEIIQNHSDINLKTSPWLPWKPDYNGTKESTNSKGAGKWRVVTTSNFLRRCHFHVKEFLPITLQIPSCILWLKFRKQNNKHLEQKHNHIIERELNHNVLVTTEGQRDRFSHRFFPFHLYLALNHWTCLPKRTISFMQTPKHAPNNTDKRYWVENPLDKGKLTSDSKTCWFWALI